MSETPTPFALSDELKVNERGHYQLSGYWSGERVEVELDPSVQAPPSNDNSSARVVGSYDRIKAAARRRIEAGEARRVHEPGKDVFDYLLVTVLPEDIA